MFGNRYNLNGTTFLEDTEVDFSESFWKLQISALEAAEKKAKDIHNANQKSDKVDLFMERYNLNLGHLNSTLNTEVDFSESFWKLQLSALEAAEKKAKVIHNASQKSDKVDQFIEANKGILTTPFLSPNKVLSIMTDYQEDPNVEKSYFSRRTIKIAISFIFIATLVIFYKVLKMSQK